MNRWQTGALGFGLFLVGLAVFLPIDKQHQTQRTDAQIQRADACIKYVFDNCVGTHQQCYQKVKEVCVPEFCND